MWEQFKSAWREHWGFYLVAGALAGVTAYGMSRARVPGRTAVLWAAGVPLALSAGLALAGGPHRLEG